MKKEYNKPQIYVEQFELSVHIAACNLTPLNAQDSNTCVSYGVMDGFDGEIPVFTSANNACFVNPEDEACLFTQAESTVSFNS